MHRKSSFRISIVVFKFGILRTTTPTWTWYIFNRISQESTCVIALQINFLKPLINSIVFSTKTKCQPFSVVRWYSSQVCHDIKQFYGSRRGIRATKDPKTLSNYIILFRPFRSFCFCKRERERERKATAMTSMAYY